MVLSTELAPAPRRHGVDLDHARIRRDLHAIQACIGGRVVALDANLLALRGSGVFDGRAEIEVVLGGFGRRHEHVQDAVARLDTERGANHERIRLEPARRGLGASTAGP